MLITALRIETRRVRNDDVTSKRTQKNRLKDCCVCNAVKAIEEPSVVLTAIATTSASTGGGAG